MESKLKVLASVYVLDQKDVGGGNILYEWISRLAEYVNLTVVTTGAKLHDECGLEERSDIELIKLIPMVSFKRWDVFNRTVHPGYFEYFIRSRKVINKLVKERHFDLCHHFSPRSIRWPSPFLDVDLPFVVGPFHGGLKTPDIMKELGEKEGLLLKLRGIDRLRLMVDPWLIKHYKKASRLLISADYVKDVLKPVVKNDEKYVVMPPPPTNLPEFTLKEKYEAQNSKEVSLLFVGRLVPSKGLELLIEAIGKVKNRNFKLNIYGKGEYAETYLELARKKRVADKINWLGFVPNNQVHQAMIQSDLFVFPSLREPTGIAITEAMGLGLPVICVDYGGPAFIVNKDCGIKIPLASKNEMINGLATAIDFLADNPEIRKKMGQAGIKRIEECFSWKAVVQKMLDVYADVVDENKNCK